MNKVTPKGYWYKEIDSTMDEAKRLIKAGQIKDTAFVVSESQTAGRGTHGRTWNSPWDLGIYLSVIHLPKENKLFETTTLYTQAVGVACIEAIKEITEIEPKLKPINDIYFNNKKLGGILIESSLHSKGISCLISGVGINIYKVDHKLDRGTIEPISLEEIIPERSFQNFLKKKLIEEIVNKICFWYEKIFSGEHSKVEKMWEFYSVK